VVATGIEADAAARPEPAKNFSFAPRTPPREEKPVVVPQAAAPAPEPAPAPSPTPAAQLVQEAPAEERIVLQPPEPTSAAEPLELTNLFNDELLLQPESAVPTPTAAPAPEETSSGNRKWVAEPEQPARRPSSSGATLFERMSNIARGAAKAQVDTEAAAPPESGDIPRFLNRQGN